MAAYYFFLLKSSLERTGDFITSQGIILGLVLAVMGVIVEIAYTKFRGEKQSENILRLILFAIGPSVGVVLIVLIYHFFHIPAEVWLKTIDLDAQVKQQQDEIAKLKEDRDAKQQRVLDLARQLPPPEIKPQQKEYLVQELKRIGPRSISIKYLREPTFRALTLAKQVAGVFESASWYVRLIEAEKDEVRNKGLAIRKDAHATKDPPEVTAIINAFSKAGLPIGTIINVNETLKQIELEVGEI